MVRVLSIGLVLAVLVGNPVIPEYPDRGQPLEDAALEVDLVERGYRNARLPSDVLIEVESMNRKRCRLEIQAADAWANMIVHATHDGIRLEATSCYRDLRAQQQAYDWNCPVTKVPTRRTVETVDKHGNPVSKVVTSYYSKRVCKVPTARPGNSNHGWGRALDLTTRGRLLTCRSAAFRWLQDNAHLYGWGHPAWAGCGRRMEEAWHWEWAGTAEQPPTVATRYVAL